MSTSHLKTYTACLLLGALVACDNDVDMASKSKRQDTSGSADAPVDGSFEPTPKEGDATEDHGDEPANLTVSHYKVDNTPTNKLVDYVLVLDNSSSMTVALNNARNGLKSAIESNVFNSDARIGVMTTMPGTTGNLAAIHPAVTGYAGARFEPGFLALANQLQLTAYAAANPTSAATFFPKALCDSGFFSPYAKHPDGHGCLDAAMQTSLKGVGVEDGIVAFSQMITLRDSNKVFRDGAEVNVIFISDVHAPGVASSAASASDLFDPTTRPTAASIASAIDKHHDIAKLTFHSIVPPSPIAGCTEPAVHWGLGTSYYPFVESTGGLKHSICDATGYAAFFEGMVKKAQAKTSYTIKLGPGVIDISSVLVNGKATPHYDFDAEREEVTLNLAKLPPEVLDVSIVPGTGIDD